MVDRLFQIVYLLIEKPKMTARELAEAFEVSERTIYRDLDKLTLAGVPVYTSQGKNGGISILPDYILDKSVLTVEEKGKIIESLNALNEVSPSGDKDAVAKLRSFLGEEYQDWIEIEFSGWGNSKEEGERFAQLKDAILKHQYVEITYSGNRKGMLKRKIKPLKLCFKEQAWYLYAYCCLREDYRFFKLKRMSQLEVSDKHFEPEAVGKVLTEGTRNYVNTKESIRVTLEISQEMAFRAYEELTDVSIMDNGKLRCQMEINDKKWFTSYVLSYGSYMRILEPLEIKEYVRQEIESMKHLYEESNGR